MFLNKEVANEHKPVLKHNSFQNVGMKVSFKTKHFASSRKHLG